MPNSDDSFHDWFRNTIGAELPKIALSPAPLARVQGALKWYSGGACDWQPSIGPIMMGMPRRGSVETPDGALLGFWGYGANSYALYIITSAGTRFRGMRLSLGGVYSDPQRDRVTILETLAILAKIDGFAKGQIAEDFLHIDMDVLTEWRITLTNGTRLHMIRDHTAALDGVSVHQGPNLSVVACRTIPPDATTELGRYLTAMLAALKIGLSHPSNR